ncbi:hypothetical protein LC612_33040 [Nostoc sp. CHAB 5834]|nr:hypothetical protein [Nostoc sp. CHAB 5834]
MFRVLMLQDSGVKAVTAHHKCIKGRPLLARGTFSAVFANDTPSADSKEDSVFKLTVDKQHYCYLTELYLERHAHKPKVINDFGIVGATSCGKDLYLVEVERLAPMPFCSARRALNTMMRRINKQCRINTPSLFPESLEGLPGLPLSYEAFLRDLNTFLNDYGAVPDLCVGQNYMLRPKDMTLVASDPVYDKALMNSARREVWGI